MAFSDASQSCSEGKSQAQDPRSCTRSVRGQFYNIFTIRRPEGHSLLRWTRELETPRCGKGTSLLHGANLSRRTRGSGTSLSWSPKRNSRAALVARHRCWRVRHRPEPGRSTQSEAGQLRSARRDRAHSALCAPSRERAPASVAGRGPGMTVIPAV